jgi:hypothetical protein
MLERYNPILTAIRDVCPTAHVGGGAVRDSLLERPIRDIDVFLKGCPDAYDTVPKLLRSQFGYVKVGEWKQYELFSDPVVAGVARFEKADEKIPICLITLKRACSIQDNLKRFDYGVCMAAWDGKEVYTAPEYVADVEAKSFTLHRADNQAQFNYSMARFKKMTAERYADWKLRVPDMFADLARDYAFKNTWSYERVLHDDDEVGAWCQMLGGLQKQELTPKAR